MSADARSTAGYGFLRAEAISIATGLNDPGFGSLFSTGYGSAGWTDTLTISRPSAFPSVDTATVQIHVGGNLSATNGRSSFNSSQAGYSVTILSASCAGECLQKSGMVKSISIGGPALTGDPPGAFSTEIPFVFDTPFEIQVDLEAYVQADAGAALGTAAIGSANFEHTLAGAEPPRSVTMPSRA